MATFTIPYQNIMVFIPDEGQLFRGEPGMGDQQVFMRKGSQLFTINRNQYSGDFGALPVINPRSEGLQYLMGGSARIQQGNPSDFVSPPVVKNEVITQNISPVNPNGITVTSSTAGKIMESPAVTDAQKAAQAAAKEVDANGQSTNQIFKPVGPVQETAPVQKPQVQQTSTTPAVLTPQQQEDYFKTQSGSANPLSPAEYLKSVQETSTPTSSTLVPSTPAPSTQLKRGDTGEEVKKLQDYLVGQGLMTQAQVDTGYGTFGPQTEAAVKTLQEKLGVDNSTGPGIFGPRTIAAVNSSPATTPVSTSPQTLSPQQQEDYFKTQSGSANPLSPAEYLKSVQDSSPIQNISSSAVTDPIVQNIQTQLADLQAQSNALKQYGLTDTEQLIKNDQGNYVPSPSAIDLTVQSIQTQLADAKAQLAALQYYGLTDTNQLTKDAQGNYVPISYTQEPDVISPIDPTKPKTENQVEVDPAYVVPEGVLSPSLQNLAVYNMPEEAYKALVPQIIPGTPEYQAAMDKLSTAYFDVLQQQMNANTEQEQQAADYNWQTLKKSIETNLNISLSNDAYQAWDQIQSLNNQYGQQNIQGSGLQNESIDSYLNKIRRSDAIARDSAQTKQEAAQQDYYMKFATPAQVAAFAQSNPDKAKAWGLVPSDEIRAAMNPAALKAKYPTLSDEDIQSYTASILDENGNYRSDLYQKYMTGSSLGAGAGNVGTTIYDQVTGSPIVTNVSPSDTGVLDINQAKKLYQAINTPYAAMQADAKARMALGTTKPTVGSSSSGGADTTLFNKVTPGTSAVPSLNQSNQTTGGYYQKPGGEPFYVGNPSINPDLIAGANYLGTSLNKTLPSVNLTTPIKTQEDANSVGNTGLQAASDAAKNLGTNSMTNTTTTTPPASSTLGTAPVVQPATKPKYNTLYDYYTAQGRSVPAWNSPERMQAALLAGIQDYTGTGPQNELLLKSLQK